MAFRFGFVLVVCLGFALGQRLPFTVSVWDAVRSSNQPTKVVVDLRVWEDQGSNLKRGTLQVDRVLDPLQFFQNYDKYYNPQEDQPPPPVLRVNIQKKIPFELGRADRSRDFRAFVDLGRLPLGLYRIKAVVGGAEGQGWLLVSDLGMVVNRWPGQMLIYTANTVTGKPQIAQVWRKAAQEPPKRSDLNGLTRFTPNDQQSHNDSSKNADFVIARSGEHWAISSNNVWFTSFRAIVSTDRPVYRPGDTVYWKAVIWDTRTLKPLAGRSVLMLGVPDQPKEGYLSDEYGAVGGSFTLPKDSSFQGVGEGRISVYQVKGVFDCSSDECRFSTGFFRIEEYKKPETVLVLTSDQARVVQGQVLRVKASVKGLFDGATQGTRITWTAHRAETTWYDRETGRWGDEDPVSFYPRKSQQFFQVIQTLDSNGEAVLELPTQPDSAGQVLNYRIIARLEEPTGEVQIAETSVFVYPANLRVSLSETPGQNLYPSQFLLGQKIDFKVSATDFGGQPQKARLQVEVRRMVGETRQVVAMQELETNPRGEATVSFSGITAGQYEVRVRGQDQQQGWWYVRGDRAQAEFYVNTTERPQVESPSYDASLTVSAKTDRERYKVGEIAVVSVQLPRGAQAALVVLETDRIIKAEVVRGSSFTLRYRVTDEMRRNAFVRITSMITTPKRTWGDDPSYEEYRIHEQTVKLEVSSEDKRLQLKLKTDKGLYRPGEKARLNVQVVDARGRPVQTQLHFGIVDEGVYLVRNEDQSMFDAMYEPREWSRVASFDSDYMWSRDRFSAADIGGDNPGREPNPVQPGRYNLGSDPNRKDLRDTMLWQSELLTDAQGQASLEFPISDNLTTWRITVRAFGKNGEVGEGRMGFRTDQEVALRILKPRYLIQGDQVQLSALLNNNLADTLKGLLQLRAPAFGINTQQEVSVQGNGLVGLAGFGAAQQLGSSTISASFDGPLKDGLQVPLEVLPRRSKDVFTAVGFSGSQPLKFRLSEGAIADGAYVYLRVVASLSEVSLRKTVSWFDRESTRADENCAFIQSYRLLQATLLKMYRKFSDQAVNQIVANNPKRLGALQEANGSWNYCSGEREDRRLSTTADVIETLLEAKKAGVEFDPKMLEQALIWLRAQVQVKSSLAIERANGLRVLALLGNPDFTTMTALEVEGGYEPQILAQLALAYVYTGKLTEARRLLAVLLPMRIERESSVYWRLSDAERNRVRTSAQSDALTTAMILELMAYLEPQNPLIGKIVMWLSRRDDYLGFASFRAGLVLERQLKNFQIPGLIEVRINGQSKERWGYISSNLHTGTTDYTFSPEKELSDVLRWDGENTLEVRTPNIFYQFEIRYSLEPQRFKPVSKEVQLERTYERLELVREGERYIYKRHKLAADAEQTDQLRVGDLVLVTLKLQMIRGFMDFLMLEEPLPAGFRPLETRNFAIEGVQQPHGQEERQQVFKQNRDDRIQYLFPLRENEQKVFQYVTRAQMGGAFVALPARAFNDSEVEVRASTTEALFVVK